MDLMFFGGSVDRIVLFYAVITIFAVKNAIYVKYYRYLWYSLMHSRYKLMLHFLHLHILPFYHTAYIYNTSKSLSSEDGWKCPLEYCYLQLQIHLRFGPDKFFHILPSFRGQFLVQMISKKCSFHPSSDTISTSLPLSHWRDHAKKNRHHFLNLTPTW